MDGGWGYPASFVDEVFARLFREFGEGAYWNLNVVVTEQTKVLKVIRVCLLDCRATKSVFACDATR
jgi:hypothetical protein